MIYLKHNELISIKVIIKIAKHVSLGRQHDTSTIKRRSRDDRTNASVNNSRIERFLFNYSLMHLSCFIFTHTGIVMDFLTDGNYPSMKIASSRALSS